MPEPIAAREDSCRFWRMNSGPNVTEASNAEAEAFQASGAGKASRIQETVSKIGG